MATLAACGLADGADPLRNVYTAAGVGGGAVGVGGGAAVGGAGGVDQAQTTVGSGGSEDPPVADPFQPPADDIDEVTETLPPGGLLDPEVVFFFPADAQSGADLPVLLFAHAEGVGELAYEQTFRHIAKFGYVVGSVEYSLGIDPDHHAPADSLAGAIELLNSSPPDQLATIVDTSRIAIGGHGLGAKSALWLALEDTTLAAVLAIDPIDDDDSLFSSSKRPSLTPEMMDDLTVPTLYLASEHGAAGLFPCVDTASNACRFHEETPAGSDAWLAVFEDFGHLQFVDNYSCLSCLTCERGPANEHDASQATARGLAVAFLGLTLKEQSGYADYLEGAEFAALRSANRILDDQEQFAFCE